MTWNVTTLTTLNARLARVIQDTTQAGSPAILRTTGGLSADHELLRNVILTSALTITNDDYEDSNRSDYYYIGGALHNAFQIKICLPMTDEIYFFSTQILTMF